jgi:hypothetical protein
MKEGNCSVGYYKITSVRTGGADREHVPTAAQDRRRTKFAENAEAVLSWLTPANAAPTSETFPVHVCCYLRQRRGAKKLQVVRGLGEITTLVLRSHDALSRPQGSTTPPAEGRRARAQLGSCPMGRSAARPQWFPGMDGAEAEDGPATMSLRWSGLPHYRTTGLGIAGIPPVVTGKRCPAWMLDEDAELRRKHKAVRDAAAARRKRGERPTRAVQ